METTISLTSSTPVPARFSSSITSSLDSAVVTPTPIVTRGKQTVKINELVLYNVIHFRLMFGTKS